MPIQHILITGASGFIGSHVCPRLEKAGLPYTALLRKNASPSSVLDPEKTISLDWPRDIPSLNCKQFSCFIHLAYAPIRQSMTDDEMEQIHIAPLRALVEQIQRSNPDCHFVFVSSQSSLEETESRYGQIKFAIEEILKNSTLSWTIIRPGFVFGESSKGLFGKILTLIRKSPIVPLIGDETNLIQPVHVHDIAQALVEIAKDPMPHRRRDYFLATPAVSFHGFLKSIAKALGRNSFFIPLPKALCSCGLALLEKAMHNPPFTKANLLGFLELQVLDTHAGWAALNMKPTPLDTALEEFSLLKTGVSPLRNEALLFFSVLFGGEAPKSLLDRYEEAHRTFPKSQKREDVNLSYILKYGLDIEALEFALRKKHTLLSKKFLLISYLAELEASLSPAYINTKTKIVQAYGILGFQVFRSIYKRIKGHLILWRHPSCLTQL